ncbi:MAG: DNA polymerase II large subunit [Candidatus Woesearchaeota archaeon]|nr:DNA polymerase II large subunit [Candidatus Woesearchaeota archaeon]
MIANPEMQKYFDKLNTSVNKAHAFATLARIKNFDPEPKVEILLAQNLAERLVGLISVVAPQLLNSGVVERIFELEKQYGALDWRVALKIAEEVATQKFCSFESQHKAIDVGIRTGFAYSTVAVLSSPLDGIINIEFKKRLDGSGEYLCVNYGGPIRNAGGTNASVSVLIADYVRKKMGFGVYDPTPDEIKRASTELADYHERVTNLQYIPSDKETEFLLSHLPVEVSGDASEDIEVSTYKDLPRIPTNKIRSGYCLMLSSCLALKAPKLWKQLSVWGADFGLEHWFFLKEFLDIQKKSKAQGGTEKTAGISPDYTYIHDLVAGRPVFSHPLRSGGFRLRYGRARSSGFSSCAVNPATMVVSLEYLGTGTQLKHERPSKGTTLSACDTIEGPIVKLRDGSVIKLNSFERAKEFENMISEILYLGDYLVCYGDFFNRAHSLVPAGYCEEWWVQEVEKNIITLFGAFDKKKAADFCGVPIEILEQSLHPQSLVTIAASHALALTKLAPLHPQYTFFWNSITKEDIERFALWFCSGRVLEGKLRLSVTPEKRLLELIGCEHVLCDNQVVLDIDCTIIINALFRRHSIEEIHERINKADDVLQAINSLAEFTVRDKCGTFIGARMGRPEKAKMRKLTGSPHMLFPVGDEGGKYRSVQNALEKGQITSEFPQFTCDSCNIRTVHSVCDECNAPAIRLFCCKQCGWIRTSACPSHGDTTLFGMLPLSIQKLFSAQIKRLGMSAYPDLIKGVRGTMGKNHTPEHLAKGVLRAKHEIFVNKDGTTRYDMTQMPMTHFRPLEIGTSIEKLKELGYAKDIHGVELKNPEQILEIKPQDVVLPSCPESPDEPADEVLARVASFVDDELVSLYGLQPYYSLKTPRDIVGHMVLCLAPHTSAGILGRIIGFTQTLAFFAHPYIHAATRRDCDGDEACVVLLMDAFLNFSRSFLPDSRGSTMDAPLVLTTVMIPSEVDDMAFDVDIAWQYPLALYEAALQFKPPWDVKIPLIKGVLAKPEQYEGMGFTHDCADINKSIHCSAYKTLPSMEDKLKGQMLLAERIRAVDVEDVARLVIEKHFLKDAKGNLRKFSTQEFRCVGCNTKYRRPPLIGKCLHCKGKLIFTVSEGNVVKYVEPAISLANKYNLSPYLKQTLNLLQRRIEAVFGKDKEKQTGLGAWFG